MIIAALQVQGSFAARTFTHPRNDFDTFINPLNVLREYVKSRQCLSVRFVLLQRKPSLSS